MKCGFFCVSLKQEGIGVALAGDRMRVSCWQLVGWVQAELQGDGRLQGLMVR